MLDEIGWVKIFYLSCFHNAEINEVTCNGFHKALDLMFQIVKQGLLTLKQAIKGIQALQLVAEEFQIGLSEVVLH